MIDERYVVEEASGLAEGELDPGDGAVLVRSRRPVAPELVPRPVVRHAGDPPRTPCRRFVLPEVELPHPVRPGRHRRERGLAGLGQLPAFALVVLLEQQALGVEQPGHGALREPVAGVGASPRRGDAPTPDARSPKPRSRHGAPLEPAAATAPSAGIRPGPVPASADRCVRGFRPVERTSRSASRLRSGLPQGPRRAQAAHR